MTFGSKNGGENIVENEYVYINNDEFGGESNNNNNNSDEMMVSDGVALIINDPLLTTSQISEAPDNQYKNVGLSFKSQVGYRVFLHLSIRISGCTFSGHVTPLLLRLII